MKIYSQKTKLNFIFTFLIFLLFSATPSSFGSQVPIGKTVKIQELGIALIPGIETFKENVPIPQKIRGSRVIDVTINSPAYKAGLRKGDLITGVGPSDNNSQLWFPRNPKDFLNTLAKNYRSGDRVNFSISKFESDGTVQSQKLKIDFFDQIKIPEDTIVAKNNPIDTQPNSKISEKKIFSKNKSIDMESHLEESSKKANQLSPPSTSNVKTKKKLLGILVQDYLQYGKNEGVLVANIMRNTPAEEIFRPDDVITHIDGVKVNSSNELIKFLQKMPEYQQTSSLAILRNRRWLSVVAKLLNTLEGQNDLVRQNRYCGVRGAKDYNGNMLFIVPTEYVIRLNQSGTLRKTIKNFSDIQTTGLFHQLLQNKWCKQESPEIIIPIEFLNDQYFKKLLEIINLIPSSNSSSYKTANNYLIRNTGQDFNLELMEYKKNRKNDNWLLSEKLILENDPNLRLGISVSNYVQFWENKGAIILAVEKTANASGKLKKDDVILKIDNEEIFSSKDVVQFIENLPKEKDEVSILLLRGDEGLNINLKLTPNYKLNYKNKGINCSLRVAKDKNLNRILIGPIAYLYHLSSKNPSELKQVFDLAEDSNHGEGAFHTLEQNKWCFKGIHEIYIPTALFNPNSTTGLKAQINTAFLASKFSKDKQIAFVIKNTPKGNLNNFEKNELQENDKWLSAHNLVYKKKYQPSPPTSSYSDYRNKYRSSPKTYNYPNYLNQYQSPQQTYKYPNYLNKYQSPPSAYGLPGYSSPNQKQPRVNPLYSSPTYKQSKPYERNESYKIDNEPKNSITSNPFDSFFWFFANSGVFLEFGDEIFCSIKSAIKKDASEDLFDSASFKSCRNYARQKIAHIEENHPFASLIGASLGYIFCAPAAWLFFIFYGKWGYNASFSEVFKKVFQAELFESGICVFGQVFTDGNFGLALLSVGYGAVSGIIRGGGVAFMYKYKRDSVFRFNVGIIIAAVIFAFCYFVSLSNEAHAGGMGGALKNSLRNSGDLGKVFKPQAAPPRPQYPAPSSTPKLRVPIQKISPPPVRTLPIQQPKFPKVSQNLNIKPTKQLKPNIPNKALEAKKQTRSDFIENIRKNGNSNQSQTKKALKETASLPQKPEGHLANVDKLKRNMGQLPNGRLKNEAGSKIRSETQKAATLKSKNEKIISDKKWQEKQAINQKVIAKRKENDKRFFENKKRNEEFARTKKANNEKLLAKKEKTTTGLETRGYKAKPGERTIQGQVDAAVQQGGGNPTIQRGGQDLFRLRKKGHGFSGVSATPQNVRNLTPEGEAIFGKGADRSVSSRDIRELYKAQTGQGSSKIRTKSGN